MADWRIPLSDLDFAEEEEAAVMRVLRSKWLSMGAEVQAFENEFAALQEATYSIAVANATAGLHLAFLALGIGPGDEVIQPALNFVATANMTAAVGATPVFADIIDIAEPTIDPSHVTQLITSHTKAIVVMHYGGNLCRMSEIMEICSKHGLLLIEDACHALGARYTEHGGRPPHGQMAGSIGDVGAFSFFSNKNLSTGEGGMLVTNRSEIADRARLLRSHGMSSLTWDRHRGHASSYDVMLNGFNYRFDEMRAAIGRVQLAKLARNNERRRRLLARYRDALQAVPGWLMPFSDCVDLSAGHLMVVVAPDTAARGKAVAALRGARIQSSLHYPDIPHFTAFSGDQMNSVPKTKDFSARAITLPLFPTMAEENVNEIVECFRSVAA